ncbi:redoxin domain-containing protein [Nonomuraea longispora]|uniref:Redoxin domain-containing protein n=1 Tax=Nonomuraea longispora TaxID=1848320 RepID=A0A4R4NM74_9ACTN|nr:redoxin domain-containing protein [Nonomuraea longispora]TDC10541.1 redoxin domain-containing protein [Nonomuraea longispora]
MTTTTMFALTWAVLLGSVALTLFMAAKLRFVLDPFRHQPADLGLPEGASAPAFSASTLDGAVLDTEDYAERAFTLVFVSHHCPSCREHLPHMKALWSLAASAGSELVMVVFDEESGSRAEAERMVAEHAVPARTVLAAPGHPLRELYNPRQATPLYCHVESGVVRGSGPLGSQGWQNLVRGWQADVVGAR